MRAVNDHRVRGKRALRICDTGQVRHNSCGLILAVLLPLAITAWSYWPIIAGLFNAWQRNDNYSAGQLVPLIALFLVWRQRKTLARCPLVPCWAGGIALLALAQIGHIFGLLITSSLVEWYALVLTVASLVLMVAGWQVFRSVSWILLFLFLMVPLPTPVHNLINGPLQRLATMGSAFILQAFVWVRQQGNTMILNGETHLGLAEACSGLRMLMAFIIVAAFIAFMVKRSRLQKAALLISSIPVAIACNILRIVVTAILMLYVSTEAGNKFFHDFAGLVMMPAAVLLLFGELWLMDRLTVSEPEPRQVHTRARAKSTTESTEGTE